MHPRLALATVQGVLVEQVLRHLVVGGIQALEVGDVVTQLFDGLHLLIQVVGLQEVTHLRDKKVTFSENTSWELKFLFRVEAFYKDLKKKQNNNVHEGLHVLRPTCAGQAEPGWRSSQAAVRAPWHPAHWPTHHVQVSVEQKKQQNMKVN